MCCLHYRLWFSIILHFKEDIKTKDKVMVNLVDKVIGGCEMFREYKYKIRYKFTYTVLLFMLFIFCE